VPEREIIKIPVIRVMVDELGPPDGKIHERMAVAGAE